MLSFDKIRDLERMERQEKTLQQIPDDFLTELQEYLSRKEKMSQQTPEGQEFENVKQTIKNLFEKREHKIIEAATEFVHHGLQPKNIAPQEKELFSRVVESLKQHRGDREQLLRGEQPQPRQDITPAPVPEPPVSLQKQIIYRVKTELPPFVGPDLQIYTLKKNEVVSLPQPLNDLLLNEGVLERVEIRGSYENSQDTKKVLPAL